MSAGQLSSAVVVAALAAMAALSSACAPRNGGLRGAGDTVYVGVAAARTSLAYFRGVQLALDRLNADRPNGAAPLAIRLPPDSQPSQVAVADYFRDDRWVIGVVGHTGSAQTMEAAPVYGDVAHLPNG
jgi:hypothetical protein